MQYTCSLSGAFIGQGREGQARVSNGHRAGWQQEACQRSLCGQEARPAPIARPKPDSAVRRRTAVWPPRGSAIAARDGPTACSPCPSTPPPPAAPRRAARGHGGRLFISTAARPRSCSTGWIWWRGRIRDGAGLGSGALSPRCARGLESRDRRRAVFAAAPAAMRDEDACPSPTPRSTSPSRSACSTRSTICPARWPDPPRAEARRPVPRRLRRRRQPAAAAPGDARGRGGRGPRLPRRASIRRSTCARPATCCPRRLRLAGGGPGGGRGPLSVASPGWSRTCARWARPTSSPALAGPFGRARPRRRHGRFRRRGRRQDRGAVRDRLSERLGAGARSAAAGAARQRHRLARGRTQAAVALRRARDRSGRAGRSVRAAPDSARGPQPSACSSPSSSTAQQTASSSRWRPRATSQAGARSASACRSRTDRGSRARWRRRARDARAPVACGARPGGRGTRGDRDQQMERSRPARRRARRIAQRA